MKSNDKEHWYYNILKLLKLEFYTAQEAAQLAKQKTEQYDRTWGWLGAPRIPSRRTWEKYLIN